MVYHIFRLTLAALAGAATNTKLNSGTPPWNSTSFLLIYFRKLVCLWNGLRHCFGHLVRHSLHSASWRCP